MELPISKIIHIDNTANLRAVFVCKLAGIRCAVSSNRSTGNPCSDGIKWLFILARNRRLNGYSTWHFSNFNGRLCKWQICVSTRELRWFTADVASIQLRAGAELHSMIGSTRLVMQCRRISTAQLDWWLAYSMMVGRLLLQLPEQYGFKRATALAIRPDTSKAILEYFDDITKH